VRYRIVTNSGRGRVILDDIDMLIRYTFALAAGTSMESMRTGRRGPSFRVIPS
jgi:hypothetical protein